jgi:N-acetylmuramoyl-L-alanine amidase
MVKVIQDFINVPKWDAHPMNPTYITIHTTRNQKKGANAPMHARYLHNIDVTKKRWHETVDENICIQHLSHNINAWASGDGLHGPGNRNSIQIEICENVDGNFNKAVENAVVRVQQLMSQYNIPITRVVPHKHWSGKDCPHVLLKDWDGLISRIKEEKEYTPPKREVESEIVTNQKGKYLNLHPHMEEWAIYKTNVAPKKENSHADIKPGKFGGLSYKILGNPQPNVYTIQTSDYGKVNIYAPRDNDSSITNSPKYDDSVSKSKSNKKYLNLRPHMDEWGVYKLNVAPVKANQFAQLRPAKFGGLSYEILGNPQANVYTIETEDFGKVNIFAPRDRDSSITSSPLYN